MIIRYTEPNWTGFLSAPKAFTEETMRARYATVVFAFAALLPVATEAQQTDWARIASIEKAVDRQIMESRPGAEALLTRIQAAFDSQELIPALPRMAIPRTSALVSQLADGKLTIRVVGPSHPLVKGGFAAMIVGEFLYVRSDLETGTSEGSLRVIVAHELSHDRFDAVRKRLWQEVRGITAEDLAWLDARLEARAHIGAVKKLTAAGYDPATVLSYVKLLRAGQGFRAEHLSYIALAVEGAMADSVVALSAATPSAR